MQQFQVMVGSLVDLCEMGPVLRLFSFQTLSHYICRNRGFFQVFVFINVCRDSRPGAPTDSQEKRAHRSASFFLKSEGFTSASTWLSFEWPIAKDQKLLIWKLLDWNTYLRIAFMIGPCYMLSNPLRRGDPEHNLRSLRWPCGCSARTSESVVLKVFCR